MFVLRTRMHTVHAPPGHTFSAQFIWKHSDNFPGKQNSISINNEIITVRSKPWQTVSVDQKQSIFSHCPVIGPILARWGIKMPMAISSLQGQFGILLRPVACRLHGGCCRGSFRTIRSNGIHKDLTGVSHRFQIGSVISGQSWPRTLKKWLLNFILDYTHTHLSLSPRKSHDRQHLEKVEKVKQGFEMAFRKINNKIKCPGFTKIKNHLFMTRFALKWVIISANLIDPMTGFTVNANGGIIKSLLQFF